MDSSSTTLLPAHSAQRALRRYETMCGTPRQLPARAWYAIAVRLSVAAKLVHPTLARKYADRALDAEHRCERARGGLTPVVRFPISHAPTYVVVGPRTSSLYSAIRTREIAERVVERLGAGHTVLEVA